MLRNTAKMFIERFFRPETSLWIRSLYYRRLIKTFDESKEPDLSMIKPFVNEGDVVFDIGANIGIYTHFLAKLVGIKGEVHSFEPVPEVFSILKRIVEKNKISNVKLNNIAISDSEGKKKMTVPRDESGYLNFYQSYITDTQNKVDTNNRSFNVPCISLDSYAKKVNKDITFVKCDVEGHELSVIKGAQAFIWNHRPVWLLEISADPNGVNSDAKEIFEVFRKAEYCIYTREGNFFKPFHTGQTCLNYFLIPSEKKRVIKPKLINF
jgi:FkbM family methyltransferase